MQVQSRSSRWMQTCQHLRAAQRLRALGDCSGAGLAAARSRRSQLLAALMQRRGSRQRHNSDKAWLVAAAMS